MKEFNELELDIAKEILNIGLSKSADSLSFFTKDKVLINTFDLYSSEAENLKILAANFGIEDTYVLSTELKGELTGECFLIFRTNEVEELLKATLPQSVLAVPQQKKEMGEAILLELDNIVAASVITQFANILQCSSYGNVPRLDIVPPSELETFLSKRIGDNHVVCFKAEFITENVKLQPEFIWGLNDRFVEGVKAIAEEGGEVLAAYKIKP